MVSRHTPGALAISERKRADLWRNLAVVVCLLALLLSYLTIKAGRPPELVHVIDAAGNVYAGPLEPLSESRRFFDVTAIYATNAALQRSSAGFDLEELLRLYFSVKAVAKLQDDQKGWEGDSRRRSLQWKPIIESISEPVQAGAGRIVEVRGRVMMAGAFAGRSFYEEPAFRLVLTFIRNPDIGKAGAYPWICDDLVIKVHTDDRSSR